MIKDVAIILSRNDQVKFFKRELCCLDQGCATGATRSCWSRMASLQAIPDFEVLKEPRGLLRLVGITKS